MLEELERLADDIAFLTTASEGMYGLEQVAMLQIIGHLERMLHRLSEKDGMLTGDMPWWIHRKRRPVQ